jgi:hypothetical protein
MLLPDEFSVGPLADAVPLTLMLPRTEYERHFLIGNSRDDPVAVCLAGSYKYNAFHCAGNDAHKGLLIPNVRIEVDPETVLDATNYDVPLGAVVRRGATLGVMAQVDGQGYGGYSAQVVPLVSGLAEARDGYGVGFRRWAVTIGTGETRRVLFETGPKAEG